MNEVQAVDIHCHLLPDTDDGPQNIDEAIELAKVLVKNGLKTVVATPHFVVEDAKAESKSIDLKFEKLKKTLQSKGLLLNLFSGKEILASQLLPTLSNDLLRSLSINKSKYLLIEMPALNIPLWMEDLIYNLSLLNFITIIAHPERNKGVIENLPILYNFVEEGALIQIDAGSIAGHFGKKPQKTAYLLIRHGLAHFVASDAHHPHQKRAPLVKESFKIIAENFDYSLAVRLWANNPQAVINDDFVNIPTPVPFKKRFFGGWR